MKSLDLIAQEKEKLSAAFADAVRAGDEARVAQAFADFAENVQARVLAEAAEAAQCEATDRSALAARGVRQLTSAETAYYKALSDALRADAPRQALTNISVAMPQTILDSVMEDIQSRFPLLEEIQFVNTTAITKWIVNKQGTQAATWGPLTSEITKELSGAFGEISTTQCKLSAFFVVSKDLLDLGPAWLDRYVRAVLSESNALALETAIVDGTGKDQPIGMTRSVADTVSVTGGVYPQKEKIAVTSFSPAEYGALIARLTKTATERQRTVTQVLLLVNPTDYFTKVLPATTALSANGTYVSGLFPFPTKVIQSVALKAGEAVLGLPRCYFMGMGSSKSGLIEYDDSVQFLEDNRVYISKLHGNGRPMDDNAFLFLDISGLAPFVPQVEITGTVTTQAAASGTDNEETA